MREFAVSLLASVIWIGLLRYGGAPLWAAISITAALNQLDHIRKSLSN